MTGIRPAPTPAAGRFLEEAHTLWYNDRMLTIISKVVVIFAMMAVGFIANKKWILPNQADGAINAYVLNIACPCMILHSMANAGFGGSALTESAQVFIGTIVYFAVTIALAWLFVRAIGYTPREDHGVMIVLTSCMNTGFMGFPITKAIFGNYYLFLMVIENILLNVYLFIVSPQLMRIGENSSRKQRSRLRMLLQPNTLATAAGLMLLLLQVEMPGPLNEFFETIGDSTIPLSMIMIGYQLAQRNVRQVLVNHKLVAACFVRMLAFPVLTFLAVNWLPIADAAKVILIFAACFPTAVIPATIAADEGKNAGLLSEGIALTTAMSIVTLPLAAFFLMNWYGIG